MLASKTGWVKAAIVGDVQYDQPPREHERLMTQAGDSAAHRVALREFGAAVLAFSDDPGHDNLERYLAASRALEQAGRTALTPAAP